MTELLEETGEQTAATQAQDDEQAPPAPEPGPEADDDETEPEPPPSAPVTDTAGLTEKEIEKRIAKLDAEAKRHAARIGEIMAEDANDLIQCELCWEKTPGFRFPVAPSDEQRQAVLEALGEGELGEYEKAIDARACDACNALGRVLTGSHVREHLTKLCPSCNGTGYVNVHGPAGANGSATHVTAPSPVIETAPEPPPDADPWGRTPDDPNYGRMPQFVR